MGEGGEDATRRVGCVLRVDLGVLTLCARAMFLLDHEDASLHRRPEQARTKRYVFEGWPKGDERRTSDTASDIRADSILLRNSVGARRKRISACPS